MEKEFLLGLMELPEEVLEAIMAESEKELQAAAQQHQLQLDRLNFEAGLREQILRCGGRNHKAITALLDTEALVGADEEAVRQAVEQVKKECGYLFSAPGVPPYAAGTGAGGGEQVKENLSLADALREKFGS